MDHDMADQLWDESLLPMGRGSRSSLQVNQSFLEMGSGIGRDTPYDSRALNAEIDSMPSSGSLSRSIPVHRPVFGPVSMGNLASMDGMFNNIRQTRPLMHNLRHLEDEYPGDRNRNELLPFSTRYARGSSSVDACSPTTSHRGLDINCDFPTIDPCTPLSSSPNFNFDCSGQDHYLGILQSSHSRPRNFNSGPGSSGMSYSLSNCSGSPSRATSRPLENTRMQTQNLMFNNQPTLNLFPPIDDNTSRQTAWGESIHGDFSWVNHDRVASMPSPSMLDPSDYGVDLAGSPLPDLTTWGIIPPTKNHFYPSDLNMTQDHMTREYLSDDATSTITTETYTAPPSETYLAVPVGPNRRLSDPHPLPPEKLDRPLSRTRSTQSPRTIVSNHVSGPRRSSFIGRASGICAESSIGPRRTEVDLSSPPQRGRRQGPMREDQRRAVRDKRAARSTCIKCKISKIACDSVPGSDACKKCQVVKPNANKPYVCIKAHFLEYVQAGTIDFISQHSINHLRKDQVHRRRLDIPQTIDFKKLMPLIHSLGQDYDFRVSQETAKLYDVDLKASYEYLDSIRRTLPPQYCYQKFINSQIQRDDDWSVCVRESESFKDLLNILVAWNTSPSRDTFSIVRKRDGYARILDPDNPKDLPALFAAALISRVTSRKLELAAYGQLQLNLFNTPASPKPEQLSRLGNVLVSLRWQISWVSELNCGFTVSSSEYNEFLAFTKRASLLCNTLYFYYCWQRRMLAAPDSATYQQTTRYIDTQCEVTEMLPNDESWDGLHKWMDEGKGKIQESGAEKQLKAVGLTRD